MRQMDVPDWLIEEVREEIREEARTGLDDGECRMYVCKEWTEGDVRGCLDGYLELRGASRYEEQYDGCYDDELQWVSVASDCLDIYACDAETGEDIAVSITNLNKITDYRYEAYNGGNPLIYRPKKRKQKISA